MKIQTLSMVLGTKCNANCRFCISKCTYNPNHDQDSVRRMYSGSERALRYAAFHGVDTVIITSKGEPTLPEYHHTLCLLVAEARTQGIPLVEIQTNGLEFNKCFLKNSPDCLRLTDLQRAGLTGVSISIAGENPEMSASVMNIKPYDYVDLAHEIMNRGLLCRISAVLNREGFTDHRSIIDFTDRMVKAGLHQLTLREMGSPGVDNGSDKAREVADWVRRYEMPVAPLKDYFDREGTELRVLPWGAIVYDYRGMSVCLNDCLPRNPNEDDNFRSVILQPDGHVYHSWEYKGSILF